MTKDKIININIGCGNRVTKGYINFDNSFSVRLKIFPLFFEGRALANSFERIKGEYKLGTI